MAKEPDEYSGKEAQARFEAALRGGLKTPHKPLKEKPKVKKAAKATKKLFAEWSRIRFNKRTAGVTPPPPKPQSVTSLVWF
jgi:hypothetical protein